MDTKFYYTEIEINSPSFFYIVHRCSICLPLLIRQASMRYPTPVSAYHSWPEPQQQWYGCEIPESSRQWRHKDSILHKPPRSKCHSGLNLGTRVATALMGHLVPCVLSTFVAKFDWDTLAGLCGRVFKKNLERFILYRRKSYHDPTHSLFVVNF
jgi:hypothetical protein